MFQIARIVVDIALNREFDYIIPEALLGKALPGCRAVVPFGKSTRTGYIVALADKSARTDLKEIHSLVDNESLISDEVLRLARWMADYYCAPVEHGVRTVLPGAVRRRGAKFRKRLFVERVVPSGTEVKCSAKQQHVLSVLGAGPGMRMTRLTAESGVTSAVIKALEKKRLVRIVQCTETRTAMAGHGVVRTRALDLMPKQAEALADAVASIDTLDPPVILLHGVTGSGKTEVYLQAIEHVLSKGQGAIVLVPEISLTPQTVERFRGRFGETVAVLHSNLSDGERHDEWHRIHEGKARIAVGARSAVFAPVSKLGLIVVDEEHDTSYKQDESPRYNARDVAVMRGKMAGCSVLLGSATPSLESYSNARSGKYGISMLTERADHRRMPVMRLVDMRIEAEREGRPNVFSRDLVEAVRARLDRGEQTILFLNRRGYSTSLVCPRCGYVAMCNMCSIALTYHRRTEDLRCHVCGSARAVPARCPQCADPAFKYSGIGTQRVENIVRTLFKHARIERMDSDATTGKDSHARILGGFKTGKIDILVGTQMIAKGLDFPNVTLIGVIQADLSLYMPDFRASERTFQLLTQVAGRAGRGDVPGEVIVQTYTPSQPALQSARLMDYEGFYEREIKSRGELSYPPCAHLVCITVRGVSELQVERSIQTFARELGKRVPARVILSGPAPAPLAKAKGSFRFQLFLRSRSVRAMTDPVKEILRDFKWPPKVSCSVDVDAISLL
jgi:primosomal protein N' (replication factor Y)